MSSASTDSTDLSQRLVEAAPPLPPPPSGRRGLAPHLVTVTLEDYYHVGAFRQLIRRSHWYRFESRLEAGTLRTLELLEEFGLRATVFTLGWVAEEFPELVRMVAGRGHEVASKGYYHRSIRNLTPEEFREDLARAREAIERASGSTVRGVRVSDWLSARDTWALDVIAHAGYAYDSSLRLLGREVAAEPWRRFVHAHRTGPHKLWEFPLPTLSAFGAVVPIAGGNYFRQLPAPLVRRAVRHWSETYDAPFVLYFQSWELDPDQPRIRAASPLARLRHYRNIPQMPAILRYYFARYRFTSIADYLELSLEKAAAPERRSAVTTEREPVTAGGTPVAIRVNGDSARATPDRAARTPITLVVPCYNEEETLPYLANTLRQLERELGGTYDFHFVFVDDGSRDRSAEVLQALFGNQQRCSILRHEQNRGIAAAIMTGIRAATTEVVCSIDCDCSYDPHELARLVPMLEEGVDVVTASPYHPLGGVRNVPRWRLVLSRSASHLYRRVLRNKLHTYTSCFRVYRRSSVVGVDIRRGDFLGVAELLGRLDLRGGRIVECPAVLESRLLGHSKIRVLRVIGGHLKLLAELARAGANREAPPGVEQALPQAARVERV